MLHNKIREDFASAISKIQAPTDVGVAEAAPSHHFLMDIDRELPGAWILPSDAQKVAPSVRGMSQMVVTVTMATYMNGLSNYFVDVFKQVRNVSAYTLGRQFGGKKTGNGQAMLSILSWKKDKIQILDLFEDLFPATSPFRAMYDFSFQQTNDKVVTLTWERKDKTYIRSKSKKAGTYSMDMQINHYVSVEIGSTTPKDGNRIMFTKYPDLSARELMGSGAISMLGLSKVLTKYGFKEKERHDDTFKTHTVTVGQALGAKMVDHCLGG